MHKYIPARNAPEVICSRLASLNAPQLPLFRAAADDRIAVAGIYGPDVRWPAAGLAPSRLPTVILIGADIDGSEPDRPSECWRCRNKLGAWARAAIIHGASGEADHYRLAVSVAERLRRLALIECRSDHIQGWASLPWCVTPLVISPRDHAHPVAPTRDAMH